MSKNDFVCSCSCPKWAIKIATELAFSEDSFIWIFRSPEAFIVSDTLTPEDFADKKLFTEFARISPSGQVWHLEEESCI